MPYMHEIKTRIANKAKITRTVVLERTTVPITVIYNREHRGMLNNVQELLQF